jgi:AcrR family transcriptional regulator
MSEHDEPHLAATTTEKQRRILEAAIEVFAERGFAGTPTAEIAKRAGVAEGTIFKHYRTKKELLIGVVAPLFAQLVVPKVIAPVIEILQQPHETFEELVRALAKERVSFVRQHASIVRIFVQELSFHPELRDLAVDTLGPRLLPLALGAIERFQANGQIVAHAAPTSVLRLFVGTMMSYAATRFVLFPQREWDDDAEIELIVRMISRGLAP